MFDRGIKKEIESRNLGWIRLEFDSTAHRGVADLKA